MAYKINIDSNGGFITVIFDGSSTLDDKYTAIEEIVTHSKTIQRQMSLLMLARWNICC